MRTPDPYDDLDAIAQRRKERFDREVGVFTGTVRLAIERHYHEHEAWLASMADHFDKMVAASMNNRHKDTKVELMRDFIAGLASHFNERYSRR